MKQLVLTILATLLLVPTVQAGNVHLDFSGVAWPDFSGEGKSVADQKQAIFDFVTADYAEFTWLTFSFADNAGLVTDTVIEFGEAAAPGSFGSAHIIDWDDTIPAHNNTNAANNTVGSAIDVTVSGITGFGAPFTDNFARFTTAVGGTASHELGHGIGLRHFDTFGPSPVAGNPNAVEHHHILATGSTGIPLTGRTDYDRAFSEHSRDKLHYNDPANKATRKRNEINPAANAHASIATAEDLTIGPADEIAAVGREVMTKVGSIVSGETSDFYSFDANMGDKIYAHLVSSNIVGNPNAINTILRLYDPTQTEIYENDNIGYTAGSGVGDHTLLNPDHLEGAGGIDASAYADSVFSEEFLDAPFTDRSNDSVLLDSPSGDYFELLMNGTYYLEVDNVTSGDLGNYQLFVSIERADQIDPPGGNGIPEPGTGSMLIVLSGLGLLARRRNRQRS